MKNFKIGFAALLVLATFGFFSYFLMDKEADLKAEFFDSKPSHIQEKYTEIEQDYITLFSLNYYADNKIEDLKKLKLSLIELRHEAQNAQN